jgi:hypothetical protein
MFAGCWRKNRTHGGEKKRHRRFPEYYGLLRQENKHHRSL